MNEAEKDETPIIEPEAPEVTEYAQNPSTKIEVQEVMGLSDGAVVVETESTPEEATGEQATEVTGILTEAEKLPDVTPEIPPAPVVPASPPPLPTDPAPVKPEPSSGGVLVLQWLCYAFWFWFSVSLCWLSAVVINYYISGNSAANYGWGSQLAYPLASVIIMFLIAFITDWFYAKHEPEKKTGAANVIMLLHVVPFVLIAIGGLVSVVFSMITMLLNSDPVSSIDGVISVMLVSGIVTLLFGLAAARAFFGKKKRIRTIALAVYALLTVGFITAGLLGPAAQAVRTKDDRLIEQALPSLSSDIQNYAAKNNKLPTAISDVTHDDSYSAESVQKLIDSKLVTYKANTLPSSEGNSYSPLDMDDKDLSVSGSVGSGVSLPSTGTTQKRFYYQLCTTYKQEKKNQYNYTEDSTEAAYTLGSNAGVTADYRYNYVSTIAAHPAGEVCYNLYADGKYDYQPLNSN